MGAVATLAVITGIVASLIGSVLALVGVYRYKIKEAEEKGRMSRQFVEIQDDVLCAHAKIRDLQAVQNILERNVALTMQRLSSVDEKVDESNLKLDKLLELHMNNR